MNRTAAAFRATDFLAPKHWPTWFGLALLRTVTLLPRRTQLQLGAALGRLLYILMPGRRRVVEINLALTFPQLGDDDRRAIARRNLEHTASAAFETAYSWWADPKELERLVHIEGMENMERARAEGKGVIMLGGHFTSMLMCGRLLAMHLPFHILVKPARNELYENLIHHYRARDYAGIIDAADLRSMVRKLKKGEVVWYSPDQDFGRDRSVFAPFMGVPAATVTATARLAKLSGSPVVPIDFERLPDGDGYRMRLLPALQDFPSGDDVADASQVNRLIERHVREVPDQYLWVHRRFKTRPEGESSLYPAR